MLVSFLDSWPSRYKGISLLTVKRGFPKQKIAILSRKKIFGKKTALAIFRGQLYGGRGLPLKKYDKFLNSFKFKNKFFSK